MKPIELQYSTRRKAPISSRTLRSKTINLRTKQRNYSAKASRIVLNGQNKTNGYLYGSALNLVGNLRPLLERKSSLTLRSLVTTVKSPLPYSRKPWLRNVRRTTPIAQRIRSTISSNVLAAIYNSPQNLVQLRVLPTLSKIQKISWNLFRIYTKTIT